MHRASERTKRWKSPSLPKKPKSILNLPSHGLTLRHGSLIMCHSPEFSDTSCPPGSLVRMPYDCHVPAVERNATFGPLKIDYLYLHHCAFTDVLVLSIVILLLWLGVLFYLLRSTADGYFSPTLASISEKLRVP
ncbi:hypothetical protein Poli38472_005585 [Pythium oligandrum]|uniref:Uncharacterized protein n=1 Tax=Pythium oligandrum TaxID=41045 RepID=A0A8K1CIU5_PYTOL|nr:hypothetical protein Poli38472_005585 [Pythium oligandrum]|eukprot:TMW62967.1 hypothetical protein Poli38472_005585 [Pythium oligandrum]